MKASVAKQAAGLSTWMKQAGILLVLVLLAYLPAIARCRYVWDDDEYLTANALVQAPGTAAFGAVWLQPQKSPQYYPVVFTTFWVEYRLWGLNPIGYHAVNVLLHGASAVMVWMMLTRLQVKGAWLAAAVWAVHPVMVESVAWVTERKNVLSGFFYLAAMLCFWRFSFAHGAKRAWRPYAGTVLLFTLAVLSKSVACSFPVAVLILTWYRRGKVTWRDAAWLAPFFLIGAAAGLNTAWLERTHVGATGSDWAFSWSDRVLIAGRAAWFYVGKICWPWPLVFMYPRWVVNGGAWWQWMFPGAAALALAAGVWGAMRWNAARGVLAAMLFFGATIFPALGFTNIYPMRFTFVADHYQYMASLGVIVLVAAGLCRAGARLDRRARVLAGALTVVGLMAMTARRCLAYTDDWTLWMDTVSRNPQAWAAYDNLAVIEMRRGNFDVSWEELQKSRALKPSNHVELYRALGEWYYSQHRYAEAEAPLKDALAQEGSTYMKGMAASLLGAGAAARKDYSAAERWFELATLYLPQYVPGWLNLQHVEKALGNREKERVATRRVAELQRGI